MKPLNSSFFKSFGILASLIFGLQFSSQAATEKSKSTEDPNQLEITCYIDDLQAQIYPEAEWARENLLISAVYQAAERNKQLKFEDVHYNFNLPDNPVSSLEVRIHQWRRSHTGFYDFRGAATYYDANGEKHSLGILSGTESSIGVFNGFDVRDAFENVVRHAIEQGLRKIEKIETQPAA